MNSHDESRIAESAAPVDGGEQAGLLPGVERIRIEVRVAFHASPGAIDRAGANPPLKGGVIPVLDKADSQVFPRGRRFDSMG